MRLRQVETCLLLLLTGAFEGCQKHLVHVTAVPLSPWNQCEPEGIPYYLPKPLLVVAKNVRHIDETKVGLTNPVPIPNAFDNQASYADIKANVTVPGSTTAQAANTGNTALPSAFDANSPTLPPIAEKMTPDAAANFDDGLAPDSFFTYQIIFVPDLSQKYGLRITGGPGEIRAAMNLVNGWMYTGMGPYYIKNSSTAQNIMAAGVGAMFAGRGAADVLNEVGDLARVSGTSKTERALDASEITSSMERLVSALKTQEMAPEPMCNYAEIYIYEPELQNDGTTTWRLVTEHHFDRHYLTSKLDKDALKQILELQSKHDVSAGHAERADAESMRAVELEDAKAARLRAQERLERGATGGSVPPIFMNPNGIFPPATPAGDPAAPDPVPAPMSGGNVSDPIAEAIARKAFNLPTPVNSAVPSTQVNVNTAPVKKHTFGERIGGLFHHKKDPPKIQTEINRVTEVNDLGAFDPGASTNGNATLPGQVGSDR